MTDESDSIRPEFTYREVKFRHSRDFVGILDALGISLLVSTYQAGKLVTLGAKAGKLNIRLHNFEQAMGLALHPNRLAVGSRGVIWLLQSARELAPRLEPAGTYDACYLARQSFITGNIHGHEMTWINDELWVVNTLFSCLCTLHEDFSFVPRWQPPFVSELAANDRCHLNGLAVDGGLVRYVTCMAESNESGGWRPIKATGGRVLDVASGEAVTTGMAMPHSPRVRGARLWVLNSGFGSLETVDLRTGRRDVVATVPGYTRGLAFYEHFAFVGMSRIRETAVFGGVPIAEKRDELRCAVAVVDLRSGEAVAFVEFETGVEEIFDVQVLAGARNVSLTGPYPSQDDAQDVWVVPPPGQVPKASSAGHTHATIPPSQLSDAHVTELVERGVALHRERRAGEAVELLQRAAEARPNSPHIHNHLGNAWQDCGRQDLAEKCYQRAIVADETFAPAHQNLGYLWINFGKHDEGLAHLRRAQQLQPSDVNRVMLATALPVIYASREDLVERRTRLEAEVQGLVDERISLDTRTAIMPTNFFAAYQGYDDCPLQRKLGRLYRGVNLARPRRPVSAGERIRVGFLSAHFRDHTIGRLNLGRISQLDHDKFEVTVISVGRHRDSMSEAFARAADHYVEVTGAIDAVRGQTAELALDLLVFADVGMDTLTYTLAFSRMADVQCVTWGHPVTTGSPTMDYFLSSTALETSDSDAHYTERLLRMSNLGTYYYRPQLTGTRRNRASFGLDDGTHFYFCPQTLFKIHPEFDALLAGILARDSRAEVLLIEGRQPTWTRLLRERFERNLGKLAKRVRFLPTQPNADFLELNALADVLLDPIHFGGGNTSYEGLAVGTPIVTWPGQFLRSRITLALYDKMGMHDFAVNSADEYIELAVRLGTDTEFRRAASDRIGAQSAVLFEDPAEVREFEQVLTLAHTQGQVKT